MAWPDRGPTRAFSHRSGTAVVLAVLLAIAVIGAGEPLHLHDGDTAGLFNEEHVLAALESVIGEIPLPAHVPVVALDAAGTRADSPDGARPGTVPTRHADSRAPPRV